MKNNQLPHLQFAMQVPTGLHAVSPKRSAQQVSPYLKAILSRKGGAGPGSSLVDDRQAALRYIKESQQRKK